MTTQISPHYPDSKLDNPTVDDLIDVFEDRVRYWLLAPAGLLLDTPFGFVAATSLILTYFEASTIYRTGKASTGRSKLFFREGFNDVLGGSNTPKIFSRVADLLYEEARCGFFHDGIFRSRVVFMDSVKDAVIATVPKVNGKPDEDGPIQSVVINPKQFFDAVAFHFDQYIKSLRNPDNVPLRNAFKQAVDVIWSLTTPGAIVGLMSHQHKRLAGSLTKGWNEREEYVAHPRVGR